MYIGIQEDRWSNFSAKTGDLAPSPLRSIPPHPPILTRRLSLTNPSIQTASSHTRKACAPSSHAHERHDDRSPQNILTGPLCLDFCIQKKEHKTNGFLRGLGPDTPSPASAPPPAPPPLATIPPASLTPVRSQAPCSHLNQQQPRRSRTPESNGGTPRSPRFTSRPGLTQQAPSVVPKRVAPSLTPLPLLALLQPCSGRWAEAQRTAAAETLGCCCCCGGWGSGSRRADCLLCL